MKKEELIRCLEQLPENTEVAIFDYVKNIESDSGDGSSDGIHVDFELQYMDKGKVTKESKTFVALVFDSEH